MITGGIIRFRSVIRPFSAFFFLSAFCLSTPGCQGDQTTGGGGPAPAWTMLSASDCKDSPSALPGMDTLSGDDCFSFDYSPDGTLLLTHINAALNCCPGTITADIDIADNTIRISEEEGEDAEWCRCLCLYDLSYELTGIEPGLYLIVFEEKYLEEGEVLQAMVLLEGNASDMVCVERDRWPWTDGQAGSGPEGVLGSYGGCKVFTGESVSLPGGDDQSCAEYLYDDTGTLYLDHINAGFNCCQDLIYAVITIEGNRISIGEFEDPHGGLCDCLCLFDLNYVITGLEPGEYRISIEEPYQVSAGEKIDFTVDLSPGTGGEYCVARKSYPWNMP